MKPPPPPIRFLLAVVGCWVGVRAVLLWPERAAEADLVNAAAPPLPLAEAAAPTAPTLEQRLPHAAWAAPGGPCWQPSHGVLAMGRVAGARFAALSHRFVTAPRMSYRAEQAPMKPFSPPILATIAPPLAYPPVIAPSPPPAAPAAAPGASRWSGSAWLFVRRHIGEPGLAPGGTLGGSQAGARLAYRINDDRRRPLAISARLYAPLERPQGAEAALGLDWQPVAGLPLHILAERRERIGREGRSDFGVTVYGGGERRLLRGRLRIEAYGQAGVVGLREPDLFADGSIRASTPVGPVEIGAGAWGGAQPGAARLDIGPQASLRIPIGRTAVRASAEWRFRVAGDAQPGSGPALTLATDF